MQIQDCAKPYQLVQGRHGWFLASPGDIYVGRAIITYGEYGEVEWQLLAQLLRPGLDAIEIGANIGTHTVPLAKKLAGMNRRLLAIEPQPVIFQTMCANLALNGLFNVMAENAACAEKSGWLSFGVPDYRGEYNFGGVPMREDGHGAQRVRAVTLDELMPPDFAPGMIKVDVEGFEQKVLEGAAKIIARHRPILYVENDRLDQSKSLIEYLWAANYKVCWHAPALFNPQNFAGKPENIYPNLASFNILALPNEAPLGATGFEAITDSDYHPLKPRT